MVDNVAPADTGSLDEIYANDKFNFAQFKITLLRFLPFANYLEDTTNTVARQW